MVREIMLGGSVQRVTIALNEPVRVERLVEVLDPDLAEPDLDWGAALRHTNMYEYYSEGATPFQIVFDMMHLVQREGLHAVCWITGPAVEDLLNQWFEVAERGMPSGFMTLMGKPIRRLKDISEDTLILCGSKYPDSDPEDLELAVKAAIEIRSFHDQPRSEAVDSGRSHSGESSSSANQLALAGPGLRRVDWQRPGEPRE